MRTRAPSTGRGLAFTQTPPSPPDRITACLSSIASGTQSVYLLYEYQGATPNVSTAQVVVDTDADSAMETGRDYSKGSELSSSG